MQDDFDVDKFVADCRKRVQLEEMREDLEQYYRLLKTAMVELINKDYADFVNLSTNLVSLCFLNIILYFQLKRSATEDCMFCLILALVRFDFCHMLSWCIVSLNDREVCICVLGWNG